VKLTIDARASGLALAIVVFSSLLRPLPFNESHRTSDRIIKHYHRE
jgi:hypothetical protein